MICGVDNVTNGRLYYTKDYGASFNEIRPLGDANIR